VPCVFFVLPDSAEGEMGKENKLAFVCRLSNHSYSENVLTLQQAEMEIIRWMGGIKVTERLMCSELRQRD